MALFVNFWGLSHQKSRRSGRKPKAVTRKEEEEATLHLLSLTSDHSLPLEVVEVEGKGRGVKVCLLMVWTLIVLCLSSRAACSILSPGNL